MAVYLSLPSSYGDNALQAHCTGEDDRPTIMKLTGMESKDKYKCLNVTSNSIQNKTQRNQLTNKPLHSYR